MLDTLSFRRACSRFATGVTIATVIGEGGQPEGFTANSFTSVSLDPPLVLLCIDTRANVVSHFRGNRMFAINVLSEGQKELSMRFASRVDNRFDGVDWSQQHGPPIIEGSLAQIICEARQTIEAGDHVILLGEVVEANYEDGRPLVYYSSAYRELDAVDGEE